MERTEIKYSSGFSVTLILLLLILFGGGNLIAQWNFSFSTNQEFNDNPFRTVIPQSDMISSYDVGIETEIEKLSVLYYGSYTGFREAEERNYYWHQLGFYSAGETSIWGAYFEQRINKEDNNYFDYYNLAGYFRKSFLAADINWTINSSINLMNYANLPEFNNWVGSLGFSTNKSFETKTTLLGSFLFNYKGFKNYDSTSYVSNGRGNGVNTNYGTEDVNISQIEFNGRVAQSIFENTGLALNFNIKKILSGSGFSASLIESTYGDIELYDDPLSQEGYSYGGTITQIIPGDLMVRVGYYYFDKSYPSQGIYITDTEYNDELSRQDYQNNFSATATKSFLLNETNGTALNLSLSYSLISNSSNSYFYNYKSQMISLSVNLQF